MNYLEKTENIGDHDGNNAEGGSNDGRNGLMGDIERWNTRWAFIFRHILQR